MPERNRLPGRLPPDGSELLGTDVPKVNFQAQFLE